MPRELKYTKIWNLYVNEIEKLEYLKKLVECGKPKCQSAAVRAFMHLYVTDDMVRNKVNSIVDNYVIYNSNDTISRL